MNEIANEKMICIDEEASGNYSSEVNLPTNKKLICIGKNTNIKKHTKRSTFLTVNECIDAAAATNMLHADAECFNGICTRMFIRVISIL